MLVRVFDIQRNTYFRSEVYAIINSGWYEKRLVIFSEDGDNYFKFFDYVDKRDPNAFGVLINDISSDGFYPDMKWIRHHSNDVDKKLKDYEELLDDDIRFFEYRGYSWIYEDRSLLTDLLKGSVVPVKEYAHQMPVSSNFKLEGWHYVEKPHDIDFLFDETVGFHDSVLKDLNYVSGAYVNDENQMHAVDSVRTVTMRFDSQWSRSIEMVFEGVVKLNLQPSADIMASFLYDASMFIQDETIFFFDSQIDSIDRSYDGTWIESYGLRWRFLSEHRKVLNPLI